MNNGHGNEKHGFREKKKEKKEGCLYITQVLKPYCDASHLAVP